MQTADRTAGGRARAIRNALVSQTYARSLDASTDKTRDQSVYLMAVQGGMNKVALPTMDGIPIDVSGCCCDPVCPVSTMLDNTPVIYPFSTDPSGGLQEFINFIYGQPTPVPAPPDGYPYSTVYVLFYPPYCNSTRQVVQVKDVSGNVVPAQITDLGPIPAEQIGGYVIIYPSTDTFTNIVLTASNSCSSESGDAVFFCFLAGTPVTMADGSTKAVETVTVGDRVVGAFGEINTVTALQENPLGLATISRINGDHMTTSHHPHISPDYKFCCVKPTAVSTLTYGKSHWVTVEDGRREKRLMKGVKADRIKQLEVGMSLQTLSGPRVVTTIEPVPMPTTTPVYHLAVSGSHTYVVDGYAVSGWPNEEDFDYDTWTARV